MHSYIGKSEIIELIQDNRKGFIIENISTKDIDEYINNLLIIAKNNGVNTNIFTQPKIKRVCENKYMLLLTVRKYTKISSHEYYNIKNCIKKITACSTIQEWIKNKYSK